MTAAPKPMHVRARHAVLRADAVRMQLVLADVERMALRMAHGGDVARRSMGDVIDALCAIATDAERLAQTGRMADARRYLQHAAALAAVAAGVLVGNGCSKS
ncbi:MAG TPA: hypothetical protein P5305_08960 [Rubrivivax sp.]|nr:hypothetical protein [Rubrivivax sp.]HRY88005.1 hypothetical protein [Rubrivivax sp.]